MIRLLLIICLIIILIIILFANSRTIKVYRNTFIPLDIKDLQSECGNVKLRIEQFFDKDKPTLYSNNISYCKLNDWFTNIETKTGYLSKLKFRPNTDNILGKYITNWIQNIKYPEPLQTRLQNNTKKEYSIKITNGKWHFPNHFDCTDNYLFILSGQRDAIIDGKHYTFYPGDIIYIPHKIEHEFWCSSDENMLNILFNINFEIDNSEEKNKCIEEFSRLYPDQVERVISEFDYT